MSATSATVARRPERGSRRWLLPVGVGLGYLALAQGLSLLTAGQYSSPTFWPATGVALGALLMTPKGRWPAILAAVAAAEMTSNLIFQANPMAIAGWSLANVLNPLIAATLIRRAHPDFALRSPAQLAAFVVCAGVIGPLVSGLVGTATSVTWWGSEWSRFGGWWIGDALGGVVIAPLFLAFRTPTIRRSRTEIGLSGGLLVAAVVIVFQDWGAGLDIAVTYLVLPPLVWTALRFGLRGAAVGAALLGMIGGWSTPIGYGPFTVTADANAIVLFQLYLAVMTVAALLIAVLVADLTEREVIQRESDRRQRQQAALAQLGQHSLLVAHPKDVMGRLDDALRAIAERAGESTGRSSVTASPGEPLLDPWEPLRGHRELLDAQGFVDRHPIEPDTAALAASASTIAANALDRLDQEERLRDRADELERLNDRLARAIAFREELVEMVSHELRNPLTPILGFTEVLRRSAPGDGSDPSAALDAIERNARRILSLIDELLLSARATDGELAVRPAATDVTATLRRVLAFGFSQVEVVADHAEEPSLALVDPSHLGQCVLDLVTDATRNGTPPVEIRVRTEEPDHVLVEIIDGGDVLPVEVGAEPSGRKDGATSPRDLWSGAAPGRSTVERLVEANDGSVTYRRSDATGPGALVLRFPRAEPS